jgi:single-stranded-DNA-specific exonuclease
MGHAREALELLTIASGPRAVEIAEMLSRKNDERRAVEKSIVEQAESMAVAAGMTGPDKSAIVLGHPTWHAGVVGIACSRLVEKYHRPVILMGGNEDGFHGSGRSVPGFSLHAALEECRSVLDSFGGHDMAAGVRIKADNLPAFTDLFIQAANAKLAPADLTGHTAFDTDVALEELDPGSVLEMKRLEPFGRDNPKIILRLPNVTVKGRPSLMGRDASHLTFRVGTSQRQIRMVGWRLGPLADKIPDGASVDVLFTPSINDFAGRKSVEGELVDIAVS